MASLRFPRFRRREKINIPFLLTDRDRDIIKTVHQYRFVRSTHIISLLNGSPQQILRRLQRLYHSGFLERPRAQINYFHRNGSSPIVYGLGNKGAWLLKREWNNTLPEIDWSFRNRNVGREFLDHALLVSDVMVSIEFACKEHSCFRLAATHDLETGAFSDRRPAHIQWSIEVKNRGNVGLVPDGFFAIHDTHQAETSYFFLEADRGTMPITRSNFAQSSFFRKLLAYEATWSQNIHRNKFGFNRFRVLTVTSSAERAKNLSVAANRLKKGRGLFLFTDLKSFLHDPLAQLGLTNS